ILAVALIPIKPPPTLFIELRRLGLCRNLSLSLRFFAFRNRFLFPFHRNLAFGFLLGSPTYLFLGLATALFLGLQAGFLLGLATGLVLGLQAGFLLSGLRLCLGRLQTGFLLGGLRLCLGRLQAGFLLGHLLMHDLFKRPLLKPLVFFRHNTAFHIG